LLERWPRLVYVNVGRAYDASYREGVLKDAESLGVSERVRLLTDVPQEDLVGLINSAQACVHASTREGFGLAVAEEMACGKAVVAFGIDSIPEIIEDGVDGVLVRPDDPDGLASSLLSLLGDQDRCRRIGEAARAKVVSRFTWEQTASRLEELYGEVVA
jgi:glycosyltransferase involved in cell wall biosynthesis